MPDQERSVAYRAALGETPKRVGPADAFHGAQETVLAGRKLDMVTLAAELGVGRATLYRWVGDRDQLLAEVLTANVLGVIDYATANARGTGKRFLQDGVSRFLQVLADSDAVRAFLANEGAAGVLMVTAPRGPVRPKLVARVAEVIEEEARAGRYRPPATPEQLADGLVSMAERFLHHGGDPTLNPDPATARLMIRLLLREDT